MAAHPQAPSRMPPCAVALALLLSAFLPGCGSPSGANIELRKQNQALEDRIRELAQQLEADRNRLGAMEAAATTIPVLPQNRLDRMFTVHGVELGRLTGGGDFDATEFGDEGLRVFVEPVDQDGDTLKATGSVVIEAFDLALEKDQRIGIWRFGPDEMLKYWSALLVDAFVFPCHWQQPPAHADLTVKVTFTDELTGRTYTAQKPVQVELP